MIYARKAWQLGCTLGLAAGVAHCSGPPGAGRALGDDLGSFAVAATETSNSCGPGALGSTPEFSFDVELARADTELFWDGRVGGRISAALAFVFSASVVVPLREGRSVDPGCTLIRSDQIEGQLQTDASGGVSGFSATMRFGFAADAGSSCSDEDELAAGLPRLPCSFEYALEAERTRAPAEL